MSRKKSHIYQLQAEKLRNKLNGRDYILGLDLSVFHSNSVNSYALADDLMEPLRPIVDLKVLRIMKENGKETTLSSSIKKDLVSILTETVSMNGRKEELMNAVEIYVQACLSNNIFAKEIFVISSIIQRIVLRPQLRASSTILTSCSIIQRIVLRPQRWQC